MGLLKCSILENLGKFDERFPDNFIHYFQTLENSTKAAKYKVFEVI
jgi:hypothetical protein